MYCTNVNPWTRQKGSFLSDQKIGSPTELIYGESETTQDIPLGFNQVFTWSTTQQLKKIVQSMLTAREPKQTYICPTHLENLENFFSTYAFYVISPSNQ